MAFSLAPMIRQRYFSVNGVPLAGGKLYSYQAGTSTPQATYTDSSGGTPNANPVILDANGEANVWTDVSLSYKFVLKDSTDVTQWTVDNVIGLITNNAVSTEALQDGSVTTVKLAALAVTSAKLASDSSVDANRAVTTDHIKDANITGNKLDATTTTSSDEIRNLGLVASVATNALTIALKTKAGIDPSATDYVNIGFRDSSSTVGTYNIRKLIASLSIVIPASTTIGTISADQEYIYIYAIDNAGTTELAVSLSYFDQGSVVTTLAIAGGTSRSSMYSTTARTGVPIKLIGRIKITEATAGTWATSPTELSIYPVNSKTPIAASYWVSGSPTVSATVQINYDSKEFDSHGAVTTGVGSWKFTPPENGLYLVAITAYCTAGNIFYSIYKNGTKYKNLTYTVGSTPSSGSALVKLLTTDYIDVRPDASAALGGNASLSLSGDHINIVKF